MNFTNVSIFSLIILHLVTMHCTYPSLCITSTSISLSLQLFKHKLKDTHRHHVCIL